MISPKQGKKNLIENHKSRLVDQLVLNFLYLTLALYKEFLPSFLYHKHIINIFFFSKYQIYDNFFSEDMGLTVHKYFLPYLREEK